MIKKFIDIMGVKPVHIILPMLLSFIASLLDGIGLALLVPLAKGALKNNYTFIQNIPVLKYIVRLVPQIFADSAIANKNAVIFLLSLVFSSVVIKCAVSYSNNMLSARWHGGFRLNMSVYVFDRFMTFGKMFFDRTSQSYISIVMNYSGYIVSMLNLFENTVDRILRLGIYFAIMIAISWKLTIITLIIFPALHYSLKAVISRISGIAQLTQKASIELGRRVFNVLSCIPLIKVYSKEDEIKADFSNMNKELLKLNLMATKMRELMGPIKEIITTLVLLLMMAAVITSFAKSNPTEISVFVVFFYVARRSFSMFGMFSGIKMQLAQARPQLKELYKIFDDTDKFLITEGAGVFEGLKSGIELKNLNFYYVKDRQVLNDVNLYIEKGKVTALVGPSGAGKTTIISLIVRFYDCPPGSIMADGSDIRGFTLKSLRRHMALVSQEALLLNDTLRNNMIFGLDRKVTDDELIDVSKKARLYDFISGLSDGFDTQIGDRGVKLSGGEKQRVAIARALLKKSEILILDEATSSLDSKTERLIQEAIDEAVKDRTAIMIAHRLSTIKHADKIVVIKGGCVAEQGSLGYLLNKKGEFYEYWNAQKFY
jgi:subfamily B ATP-binding cassette protein MsbA